MLDRLREALHNLWCRVVRCDPAPITHLEIDMQSAKITWKDPSSKITAVIVALKVDGAPAFTEIARVNPGVQQATIPDLADGGYTVSVQTVNGAKLGPAVTKAFAVQLTPGGVTELNVALSPEA